MGFFKVFNTLLQSVIIQKRSSNLPHFPNISEHVIFLMKHFVGVKLICIHLRYVQDHNKDFSEVLEGFLTMREKNQRLKAGMHGANIPADNKHQNSPQHSLDTHVYQ